MQENWGEFVAKEYLQAWAGVGSLNMSISCFCRMSHLYETSELFMFWRSGTKLTNKITGRLLWGVQHSQEALKCSKPQSDCHSPFGGIKLLNAVKWMCITQMKAQIFSAYDIGIWYVSDTCHLQGRLWLPCIQIDIVPYCQHTAGTQIFNVCVHQTGRCWDHRSV